MSAPIKMLHDRVLVEVDEEAGERRSSGGIVIPATAAMGARRLAWSRVIAVGPHARSVEAGDACDALAKWDGRSQTSSVGYHLVEEFVQRLPDKPWAVEFDANQPLTTPRDLKETDPAVVAAMRDAIAFFRARGTAMDAAWGTLQVAGDRRAPARAISGGTGDALGNANAVASRKPEQNKAFYRAVTYGSSHIQAIAFTDRGLRARTILTYGQADDPTSRWHADQTRLFSRSEWVRFPWTPREVRRQQVATYVVRGR